MSDIREGEITLPFDPAIMADDASLVFIGRVSSPWLSRSECPKNMRAATELGQPARIQIDAQWCEGLRGLEAASHLIVLTWLDRAPRNLIVQKPRHASEPRGTFALRSPARPNPIGVHVVCMTSHDFAAGLIELKAIDVLDGTPVIDVKPYYASSDAISEATTLT